MSAGNAAVIVTGAMVIATASGGAFGFLGSAFTLALNTGIAITIIAGITTIGAITADVLAHAGLNAGPLHIAVGPALNWRKQCTRGLF